MACSAFKYLIFAAFLWQWQNAQGTRFQPSIIWDIYNKMLSCKCNWMNIPKLDIYDRIELLCPSQILVSSTRGHDVAVTRHYYNVFMRKFNQTKHSLEKLKKSLDNGSFCDPNHNETKTVYTCKQNNIEPSVKLRFHEQEDLHVGDIAVFFCNKGTGLQQDLQSKDKKCEMVFIVNVTQHDREEYDPSYRKCFIPLSDSNCNNINQKCPCENSSAPRASIPSCPPRASITSRPPPTTPDPEQGTTKTRVVTRETQSPTTRQSATNESLGENTSGTTKTRVVSCETQSPTTRQSATNESLGENKSAKRCGTSNDNFTEPFVVGLTVGIVATLLILCLISLFVLKRKGKPKFMKNTIKKHESAERNNGYPNKGFEPETPTAPAAEFPDGKKEEDGKKEDEGKPKFIKNTTEKHELAEKKNGYPHKGFEPATPTAPPAEFPDGKKEGGGTERMIMLYQTYPSRETADYHQ